MKKRTLNIIDRAIEVASKAHKGQFRKGDDNTLEYVTHALAVGIILAREGFNDNIIAAGILHDILELENPEFNEEYIEKNFNPTVLRIVQGCTEKNLEDAWWERKKSTIEKIDEEHQYGIRAALCADKLHNIRKTADNFRSMGDKIWDDFKTGKEGQEWYNRELVRVLCIHLDLQKPGSMFHKFKQEVEDLFGENG